MQMASRARSTLESISDGSGGSSSMCLRTRRILLLASNGEPPGHHEEEDDAERIDVAPRVGRLAARLLGRHVLGRADERPVRRERPGLRRGARRLGRSRRPGARSIGASRRIFAMPKSHTFTTSIAFPSSSFAGRSMMFSGLRIAVDDAHLVRDRERGERLREDAHDALGRERETPRGGRSRRSRPSRNSIAM